MSINSRPRGPRDYSPFIITIVILLFSCSFLALIVIASAKIKLAKENQGATAIAPAYTPMAVSPAVSPSSGATGPASTIPAPVRPTSTQVVSIPVPIRSTPASTEPAATSTPSSVPATPLSFATFTPIPTDTATPTATMTPIPTDTATPTATETAIPTDTATPIPTDTATPTATATPIPTVPRTFIWGTVTAESLNIRAGPGTDYDIVERLIEGTTVELIGRNEEGDWFQIRLYDDLEGWVKAEWIQTEADIDSLPIASAES